MRYVRRQPLARAAAAPEALAGAQLGSVLATSSTTFRTCRRVPVAATRHAEPSAPPVMARPFGCEGVLANPPDPRSITVNRIRIRVWLALLAVRAFVEKIADA